MHTQTSQHSTACHSTHRGQNLLELFWEGPLADVVELVLHFGVRFRVSRGVSVVEWVRHSLGPRRSLPLHWEACTNTRIHCWHLGV